MRPELANFFSVLKGFYKCVYVGNCTVLRYEGGGGSEKLKNRVTYYVDVPLSRTLRIS